ncbi:MAG: tRNA/RRNA methyltransferase [Frankiales bacterium]|nr:tRNA/RRNA methyltransferase [Frankiales bacterium]
MPPRKRATTGAPKAIKAGGQGGRAGKAGSPRKGAAMGSGGQGKQALEGRKPTPPAELRKNHPKARAVAFAAKRAAQAPPRPPRMPKSRTGPDAPETVVGRNVVVEALRARIPASALHVALGMDVDERVSEAVALAGNAGIPVFEATKLQMDRMTGGALHQGLTLDVPPYEYLHSDDLLERALAADAPLLVALDGVTDPRNLGAVVRSAAAFGAQGVLVPERRAAGMTAAAWRTSAGAAARLPVARCTNLVRALTSYKEAGLFVAGLAADGSTPLDELEVATSPLVIVVGSEGDGLGRLVAETCDVTVSIPMVATSESLNAGIAAAVVLAEVARRRRQE